MNIEFNEREKALLFMRDIPFHASSDYTEDEALDLLDAIRDAEVFHAQGTDPESFSLYRQYQQLADKVFDLIPET